MKTSELMLGDWVRFYPSGESVRVERLTAAMIKDDGSLCYNDCTDYAPISITGDILEASGIRYKPSPCIYLWQSSCKSYHVYMMNIIDDIWSITVKGKKGEVDIYGRYVHELQHALRLCGIDFEIKVQ